MAYLDHSMLHHQIAGVYASLSTAVGGCQGTSLLRPGLNHAKGSSGALKIDCHITAICKLPLILCQFPSSPGTHLVDSINQLHYHQHMIFKGSHECRHLSVSIM